MTATEQIFQKCSVELHIANTVVMRSIARPAFTFSVVTFVAESLETSPLKSRNRVASQSFNQNNPKRLGQSKERINAQQSGFH